MCVCVCVCACVRVGLCVSGCGSGGVQEITIQASGRRSDADIKAIVTDAEATADSDTERKQDV